MIPLAQLAGYGALAAIIAGLTTNLLVPFVTRMAWALSAVDHPGGRKHQSASVPRLGGVAMAVGIAMGAGSLLVLRFAELTGQLIRPRTEVMALLFGTALVFLLGVVDDLIDVSSFKKFVIQTVAASLLVMNGWSFGVVRVLGLGEVELGLFDNVISVLFIVGVTNAINLIDGLDGLAGGVVAIISASLSVYALLFLGNPLTVVITASLTGASLGFLRHNWAPAKIFMGDSGSLTLGFLLAAASVESVKTQAWVAILVPVVALGVPVIDTLLVMLLRFIDRSSTGLAARFLSMFRADRKHLHHLLAHLGASRRRIVLTIYAVVVGSCLTALLVAWRDDPMLGLAMVAIEFVVILVIRSRGLAAQARRIAQQRVEGPAESRPD